MCSIFVYGLGFFSCLLVFFLWFYSTCILLIGGLVTSSDFTNSAEPLLTNYKPNTVMVVISTTQENGELQYYMCLPLRE